MEKVLVMLLSLSPSLSLFHSRSISVLIAADRRPNNS